jgi:hypothetical protein
VHKTVLLAWHTMNGQFGSFKETLRNDSITLELKPSFRNRLNLSWVKIIKLTWGLTVPVSCQINVYSERDTWN